MINLLQETIKAIYTSGYILQDVAFIGSPETGHRCTWLEFQKLADIEYDEDFGLQNVARDLVIAFTDGARLERADYDGQESWKHIKPFRMPDQAHPIKTLVRSEGDKSFYAKILEELNK
jgi:hypothetical protein